MKYYPGGPQTQLANFLSQSIAPPILEVNYLDLKTSPFPGSTIFDTCSSAPCLHRAPWYYVPTFPARRSYRSRGPFPSPPSCCRRRQGGRSPRACPRRCSPPSPTRPGRNGTTGPWPTAHSRTRQSFGGGRSARSTPAPGCCARPSCNSRSAFCFCCPCRRTLCAYPDQIE